MHRKIVISLMGFIALCALTVRGHAGADPAAFLKAGVGARAMALGGAFTSVAADPSTIYWNPAGLGRITRMSVTAMMQSAGSGRWDTLKDIAPSYQFVGLTFPVNTFQFPGINNTSNTFGLGVISNSLSGVPYTYVDGSGRIVRDSFEDSESAYYLSYGFPLLQDNDSIYAGASLKYITQSFSKIDGATASGMDFDFGLLYIYRTLSLGLVVQRGVDLRWANGHTDSGSLTTRFGVSNEFFLNDTVSLMPAIDLTQRQGDPLSANFGAELAYRKIEQSRIFGVDGVFLRLGLDSFVLEDRYGYSGFLNNNLNYTMGVGLELTCLGYGFQMDYATGSYRLGDKTRISVNMYF